MYNTEYVRGFFLSFYTLYMYSREYKTMYGWLAFLAKRNVPKKQNMPNSLIFHFFLYKALQKYQMEKKKKQSSVSLHADVEKKERREIVRVTVNKREYLYFQKTSDCCYFSS